MHEAFRFNGHHSNSRGIEAVKAGCLVIFLRIGRLGILYSSVPSGVPMIGSRSLPRSWKFLSLADTARTAALSADHAPTAIIGCPHMTKPLAPKNE
jgi:hypothetical protein